MTNRQRLPSIDWSHLVGGNESAPWEDDRRRKYGRIEALAEEIVKTSEHLKRRGALSRCTPEALTQVPGAGDWYVSLACYAQKTLKNMGDRARAIGLKTSPESLLKRIRERPDSIPRDSLEAFSAWVNEEISDLIGSGFPNDSQYALHVAMIAGGRVIGQGQNEGGEAAVHILKRILLDEFAPASDWEYATEDESWKVTCHDVEASIKSYRWRYAPARVLIGFTPGGNRPDIVVSREDSYDRTLVAEIKGRKDLSNAWESWMPQVADHCRTWEGEQPQALRGVFMTLITEEMVSGKSSKGTRRTGLRDLHDAHLLDFAFNLSILKDRPRDPALAEVFKLAFGLI